MPDPVPDRDLLASDGGAAGFRIFDERHVQAAVAYVARRTNKADLVLDVVAETFARALEHRAQYDASRGPAIAWLFGIARNEIATAVGRGQVADEARKREARKPPACGALRRPEAVPVRRPGRACGYGRVPAGRWALTPRAKRNSAATSRVAASAPSGNT